MTGVQTCALPISCSGTLWVGTVFGGLNKLDRARKAFYHYTSDPRNPKTLSNPVITGLSADSSGTIWIATLGGLNRFDGATETFEHYPHNPNEKNSLGAYYHRAVLAVGKRYVWLGSIGRGLDRVDPALGLVTHFDHRATDPKSLGNDFVHSLFEDRSGRIWIGASNGILDEYERNSEKFIHHVDRKSTRLNSSHSRASRMPSSA